MDDPNPIPAPPEPAMPPAVPRTPWARFTAPARLRPALWRLIAGLCVILVVYILWSIGVVAGFAVWQFGGDAWLFLDYTLDAVGTAATPGGVLVLLATFGGLIAGTWLAVRWLHKRPLASVFGRSAVVMHDFALAAGVIFAVASVLIALTLPFSPRPTWNMAPGMWLMLLPVTVLGLLLQTGAEEVVFRGYMQQQLGARFRSPWIWAVVPSAVFGALHYDPTVSSTNALVFAVWAGVFGLVAADLTARTGSLGAAWGFHFANNFFALALVPMDGTITGLGLFLSPYSVDEALTPLIILSDGVIIGATWLICRRVLSR